MKKWTKDEIVALISSVAENGYSKGIRKFMYSEENVNGRTFAACEYMIHRHRRASYDFSDALISVVQKEAEMEERKDDICDKKESLFSRIIKWFGLR